MRPFVKRYMQMMGSPFRRAGRAISAKSSSIPKCAVAVGSYDR